LPLGPFIDDFENVIPIVRSTIAEVKNLVIEDLAR